MLSREVSCVGWRKGAQLAAHFICLDHPARSVSASRTSPETSRESVMQSSAFHGQNVSDTSVCRRGRWVCRKKEDVSVVGAAGTASFVPSCALLPHVLPNE